MDFPQKLKELRKKKGYTQEKMSNLLEIGQSAYAKWENGRTQPNIEQLVKIAQILETTTDELLGIKEDKQFALEMFELLEEYLDDQYDNINFLETDYRAGYGEAIEDVHDFVLDLVDEEFSVQDMYDEYSRR